MRKTVLNFFVLCTIMISFCATGICSNAASLSNSNDKTFYVTNTDLVTGVVYVHSNIVQDYIQNGSKTTYGKRKAFCSVKYNSFVRPSVRLTNMPRHVDSNNTTTKTFSPWLNNNEASIRPPFDVLVADIYNTTEVTYGSSNSRYYYMSYQVYDTDLINNALFGDIKKALGL